MSSNANESYQETDYRVRRRHLVALGINATVGSGIFLIPGKLQAYLGGLAPYIFLLCGLMLGTVAYCFVKLSQITQRSGGPYAFATLVFPPVACFLTGWVCWITAIFSCAAVASALGIYLGHFWPALGEPFASARIAAIIVILFGLLNCIGLRFGNAAVLLVTWLKILAIFVILGCALPNLSPIPISTSIEMPKFAHVWEALLLSLFALQGFEVVPILAGQADRAKKNVPVAVFLTLIGSTLIYFLLQLFYGWVPAPLSGSERPLADLASAVMPTYGADWVAIAGIISIIGFIGGTSLGAPWYLVPLAEDRLLPSVFMKLHPRLKTPILCIAVSSGLTTLLAINLELMQLMVLSSLGVVTQYGLSVGALMILMRRQETSRKQWIIPIISLATILIILMPAPWREWLIFLILVNAGLILWVTLRRFSGQEQTEHSP